MPSSNNITIASFADNITLLSVLIIKSLIKNSKSHLERFQLFQSKKFRIVVNIPWYNPTKAPKDLNMPTTTGEFSCIHHQLFTNHTSGQPYNHQPASGHEFSRRRSSNSSTKTFSRFSFTV